jgi:uncharacterized membrane protein
MSLDSSKTLGGVGAILLAIPFLNLIGIILVLIAMKGMAEYYNENDIFQNAIYGFVFGIIGVIALIVVIIMLSFGLTVVSTTVPVQPAFPLAGIGVFVIIVIVLYIFSLLGAIFYRKSLNILSEKSGEQMFGTAGLILLIGAAIPLVGEILKFVAWILAAVGFFSIKTPSRLYATRPVAPISEEKKYCQYCGVENKGDAAFCQKCGKKILAQD